MPWWSSKTGLGELAVYLAIGLGGQACASEDAQAATQAPSDNDGVAPTVRSCTQGFATTMVSVTYGRRAGYGQDPKKHPRNPALGPPKGGADIYEGGLDVLTLGRGGQITLGFSDEESPEKGVLDGPGPDFIVFENVFQIRDSQNAYVELGEVSVSEDGIGWKAFACDTTRAPYAGCAGTKPTLCSPENGVTPFDPVLSGGDAFDLAELGLSFAKYVRITDLDAPGAYSSLDTGFDLDAISLVHAGCKSS